MRVLLLLIFASFLLHTGAEGSNNRRRPKNRPGKPHQGYLYARIEDLRTGNISLETFQTNFRGLVLKTAKDENSTNKTKIKTIKNLLNIVSKKRIVGFENYRVSMEILQENENINFSDFFIYMIRDGFSINEIRALIDENLSTFEYNDLFLLFFEEFLENHRLFEMSFPSEEIPHEVVDSFCDKNKLAYQINSSGHIKFYSPNNL